MRLSNRQTTLLVFAFVCLVVAGCGKPSGIEEAEGGHDHANASTMGTVAVIDLDAVARQIGGDVEMANSLKQRETSLKQQLQTVQASYVKQIGEKKDALGSEASEEETQQFALLQRQANLSLNQIRTKAQNELNRQRLQLIARFREEAKPVARAVAAEKGLSIVVTKNDSVVFTYQSAVDITDEVATRMLARRPAATVESAEEVSQPATAEQRDGSFR